MADFEVVFNYLKSGLGMIGFSKVYAVDVGTNSFLIVDPWGHFKWIDMNRCTLKEIYEMDNGPIVSDESD